MAKPTLLKELLTERRIQAFPDFRREYLRTAARIDPVLAQSVPSQDTYRRWLNGDVRLPHPGRCRVLERMLPGHRAEDLFRPATSRPVASLPIPSPENEDPMKRRELFNLGGAAALTALFGKLWSEPGKLIEALDTSTVSSARLGQLQLQTAELGVRAVRVPPATMLGETLARFEEARGLAAGKQPLAIQREVVRCAAMLATVMGELLFTLGQFPLAKNWYETAHRAASEAGDQVLADYAMAGTTYLYTYSHNPRGVIDHVTPRLDAAVGSSPALAWLWAFKAKAHARLGEERDFERAIDRARTTFGRSPAEQVHPGIFSFEEPKLWFYEARGRLDLGQGQQASDAAGQALALYDMTETTEPALARFEQASAAVVLGDIPQACRIAIDTVTDPATYLAATVVDRAWEFDALLGSSATDAARDWREILASLRPPDPALALAATSPGTIT